jgi:hypothetical protein
MRMAAASVYGFAGISSSPSAFVDGRLPSLLSLSLSLSLSLYMTRLIRGVVAVAAAKKIEWVRERESIKGSFYRDWDKMQQILKAGYSKPVSLAMNEDIKVGKCDLFLLVITNCFSLSLKCIKGTQKATTFLHAW